MTTLSRVLAYALAVALLGGIVVLAVAGVTAATAVLVTAGAVFALIVLGGAVGGRRAPNRPPVPRPGAGPRPGPGPGGSTVPDDGPGDETMEG